MMGKSPKVLIIDDESDVRHSLACYLEDCNFRVVEACDGLDGIEKFGLEQPDLVLTDLMMPRLDGIGVINAFKQTSPNTPIIVFTGDPTSAQETIKHGAFACITKPLIDLNNLEAVIAQALASADTKEVSGP